MKLLPSVAVNKKKTRLSESTLDGLILLLPVALAIVSLSMGRYRIDPLDVIKTLLSPVIPNFAEGIPEIAQRLVLQIRIPRTLAAILIGASFGATGTALQAVFKNPLVDSNILGVTSGAGFGAATAILLKGSSWQVQLSAFLFGLVAVSLAFFGSRLYKATPLLVLTLMGILVGSLFNSLTSLLKYAADPLDALPAITFWLLGSLTNITWRNIPAVAIRTLTGFAFFWLIRWRLNIISLGDDEAKSLGVNPIHMKMMVILAATLMTAAAVAVSGVIGWVGLVIPHAGRMLVGPDHKRLIPASIGLGAAFLILIDNIARTMLPGEIPLGVLTGLVGVPLLIVLLRRGRVGW